MKNCQILKRHRQATHSLDLSYQEIKKIKHLMLCRWDWTPTLIAQAATDINVLIITICNRIWMEVLKFTHAKTSTYDLSPYTRPNFWQRPKGPSMGLQLARQVLPWQRISIAKFYSQKNPTKRDPSHAESLSSDLFYVFLFVLSVIIFHTESKIIIKGKFLH